MEVPERANDPDVQVTCSGAQNKSGLKDLNPGLSYLEFRPIMHKAIFFN